MSCKVNVAVCLFVLKCSAKCGAGIQRRKVFCAETEDDVLRIVSSSRCDPDYKMVEEQMCAGDCSALWYTGPFGNVSEDILNILHLQV